MKRVVLVFGAFDLLHEGHRRFFAQARKHGSELVVCIARDATIRDLKRQNPVHRERSRLARVAALPLVDRAMLGDREHFHRVLQRIRPDVICLGYDQRPPMASGLGQAADALEKDVRIIRLRAYQPKRYKSSLLRRKRKSR